MYLYFNNKGILTTVIPHGEPVRQGNDLSLCFCLEQNFFDNKNPSEPTRWTINVSAKTPDKIIHGPFFPINNSVSVFTKLISSESTYDLKDGRSYYMYYFLLEKSAATYLAGNLELIVSLHSVTLDSSGETISENHEYEGTVTLFVERTFGNNGIKNNITDSQYNHLLNQINGFFSREEAVIDEKIQAKFEEILVDENGASIARFLYLPSSEVGLPVDGSKYLNTLVYWRESIYFYDTLNDGWEELGDIYSIKEINGGESNYGK